MRREANIALAAALGAIAYGGICWAIAYQTGVSVGVGRALIVSSMLVGFVLDVLAIAHARQVFERVPAGDALRERAGFARILAWIGIIVVAGLGLLMLMPPIASP